MGKLKKPPYNHTVIRPIKEMRRCCGSIKGGRGLTANVAGCSWGHISAEARKSLLGTNKTDYFTYTTSVISSNSYCDSCIG